MPADTNPYGGVFGGWLMSQMALAGGSLASRHSRRQGGGGRGATNCGFPARSQVGDEISASTSSLKKQGRTSMTIAVEAVARERDGDQGNQSRQRRFTFVALDTNDRPRAIAGQEQDNG